MLRKALTFILVATPFSTVSAAAIDFRLGSEMAEVTYKTQDATFGYGGADIGLGVFFNEDDNLLANASVLVSGSSQGDVKGLHFGVGAKVYAGVLDFPSPIDNQNGAALAIGAQVRYVFPGRTPFAILLEGFGAPNVTSASDFKGVKEIRLAVELEVTPSARAYIGYRTLEVDLADGLVGDNAVELDDRAHIGVRFSF
ncbi:MAG: YfaZ family outer membrane protein [Gammaproteobacteria bacterium]|nr:YfaZ family outer membrane protein [Gammaproteobacteria bacterium]